MLKIQLVTSLITVTIYSIKHIYNIFTTLGCKRIYKFLSSQAFIVLMSMIREHKDVNWLRTRETQTEIETRNSKPYLLCLRCYYYCFMTLFITTIT